MRTSTRSLEYSRTPDKYFGADSSLVGCWPLLPEYGLMDVVGGNHLKTGNATPYGPEKITLEGAYFNGINSSLVTTKTVDLSGTAKISVLADILFTPYTLTAAQKLYLHINAAGTSTGVATNIRGDNAGDPIQVLTATSSNFASSEYYPARTNAAKNIKQKYLFTHDRAEIAVSENKLSINGIQLIPDVHIFGTDLSGNFGNYVMYIGSTISGISQFLTGKVSNFTLLKRIVPEEENADYYAWSSDIRRPNFISMFNPPIEVFSPPSKFPKLALDVNGDDTLIIADITKDQSKDAPKNVKQREFFEGN